MSLLSSFIRDHLIKAVENEFIAHVPDIQAVIIGEVKAFADEALEWVNEKLSKDESPQGEQE